MKRGQEFFEGGAQRDGSYVYAFDDEVWGGLSRAAPCGACGDSLFVDDEFHVTVFGDDNECVV